MEIVDRVCRAFKFHNYRLHCSFSIIPQFQFLVSLSDVSYRIPENRLASRSSLCPSENEEKLCVVNETSLLKNFQFQLNTYRHMCRWEAQDVKQHRVHDSTQQRCRLVMSKRRLWKGRVEEDAVGAEFLDNPIPQLDAFFHILEALRWSNQTA